MIDRNLDPIRLGVASDWGEILQALMFTYLAKYNVDGADVNTQQAYRRAFGVTEMQFFARTGSELGFMVARIPYPWGDHIIVAIEGTYSAAQLWNWRNGIDGLTQPTGLTGHVWGNETVRADSVWTRLNASAWFMNLATARNAYVTFTGHSQGASMAAIVGARWNAAQAVRRVAVRMFGSPRFPTQRFIENYDNRIFMTSFHTRRDPIAMIPAAGLATDFSGGLVAPPYWQQSLQLFPSTWIDEFGNQSTPELQNAGWNVANAYVSIANAGGANFPNYLPFHYMWTYRLAGMNIAHRAGGLLALRILYLQHNDENQWQVRFRPNTIYDSTWFAVSDPAPAPFSDLEPEQLRLHNAGVPQPALVPNPDLEGVTTSGGGDEGWGTVDRNIAWRRRRLQHNPQPITP